MVFTNVASTTFKNLIVENDIKIDTNEQIKMFNRVSYTVPVTHKEMETIRIQTSNTSSDYQIPLIVISTADGDEKFSVHTKSFFNEHVIIRSIAKFSELSHWANQ